MHMHKKYLFIHIYIYIYIISQNNIACPECPLSDSICYLDMFLGALVVAITFVTAHNTGWTDSRLRTSLRRPRTCYLFVYRLYLDSHVVQ